MKKKLLIIVLFQNQMEGKSYFAKNPAPPLPGILLAGLTPPLVEIEVLHEMVRQIDYNTDADFIAISFMDYLAPHAFEVSEKFRKLGKIVVAGGKFCSTFPELCKGKFDSICIGDAYFIWDKIVLDMLDGKLKEEYYGDTNCSLANIPAPRYDLVEKEFTAPIVVEATRGCVHNCSYCQLTINREKYRKRPVQDVINDLKAGEKLPFFKRKMAMIIDNHLGADLNYTKDLLKEIAKLNFWGIGVQFSIECLYDDEFIDLLQKANCIMAFIGMESLNPESLSDVNKKQNKVEEYKFLFNKLHQRGILTFNGLIIGLDSDTIDYYISLADKLDEIGISAILTSIAVPIFGTPLYKKMKSESRLIDFNISHYEGDHLVFNHTHLSNESVTNAYKFINSKFYSNRKIIKRLFKFIIGIRKVDKFRRFPIRLFVSMFVYLKLTIFQRHHAEEKVFSYDDSMTTSAYSDIIQEWEKILNKKDLIFNETYRL